jgi:hypothetical protein
MENRFEEAPSGVEHIREPSEEIATLNSSVAGNDPGSIPRQDESSQK